jgi:hypothetical protein
MDLSRPCVRCDKVCDFGVYYPVLGLFLCELCFDKQELKTISRSLGDNLFMFATGYECLEEGDMS